MFFSPWVFSHQIPPKKGSLLIGFFGWESWTLLKLQNLPGPRNKGWSRCLSILTRPETNSKFTPENPMVGRCIFPERWASFEFQGVPKNHPPNNVWRMKSRNLETSLWLFFFGEWQEVIFLYISGVTNSLYISGDYKTLMFGPWGALQGLDSHHPKKGWWMRWWNWLPKMASKIWGWGPITALNHTNWTLHHCACSGGGS